MSSPFISLPPSGAPAPAAADDSIPFDGFYPALGLAAARQALRIPTDITDTRLRDALMAAMLSVADDLTAWRHVQDVAGFAVLADCSDRVIGTEKRLTVLWRRAVHHLAAADLAELQRGPDITAHGNDRAEQLDIIVGDHRRNARWAVRDMLGMARSTIELI
jgi:hypothetical protein